MYVESDMPNVIYKANDNMLIIRGLSTVDELGQSLFLDDNATVELTLKVNNVNVAGQTWPADMVYITGSNGDFFANVDDTITLPDSGVVQALLVVDNGADQHGELTSDIIIQVRRF